LFTTFVRVQEAIEKKEKRARRFHFSAEENLAQKNVVLDRDVLKKGKNCSLTIDLNVT